MNPVDDCTLVAALAAGEPDAWRAFHDCYTAAIHRYCRQRIRDPLAAEDVAAEVFVRVFVALRNGTVPLHFRGWLFRITHNLVIDHVRAARRAEFVPWLEAETMPDPAQDLKRVWQRIEQHERVQRLLDSLTPLQRRVVVLYDLEGLPSAEVAGRMSKHVGAVKGLRHRAIVKMRGEIGTQRNRNADQSENSADKSRSKADLRKSICVHQRTICVICADSGSASAQIPYQE